MRAKVHWDGYMWIGEPEKGGVTQAKRLEQIPSNLSEVALLMTGETVDPDEWELQIEYEELGGDLAELRRCRHHVEAQERDLSERTAKLANVLRERGVSLRDIGTLTELSFQRVGQLVGKGKN